MGKQLKNPVWQQLDMSMFDSLARALSQMMPIRLVLFDQEGDPLSDPVKNAQFANSAMGDFSLRAELRKVLNNRGKVTQISVGQWPVLAAPVLLEDESVGVLAGFFEKPSLVNTESAAALVNCYSQILSEHIRNRKAVTHLVDEVASRYEELSLVYQLRDSLRISRNPEDSIEIICRSATETFESDVLAACIPGLELQKIFSEESVSPQALDNLTVLLERESAGRAEGLVVNYLHRDEKFSGHFHGFCHAAYVPLLVDGFQGYFLVLRRKEKARFFSGDIRLLEALAQDMTIILSNGQFLKAKQKALGQLEERNQALVEIRDTSVFSLARLAESRDPETGEHLERMRLYARLLAENLAQTHKYRDRIDHSYIQEIFRSSPLHDIGKVGIPDSVLLKPGKLTAEEWAIMQTHTTIGGDTLRDCEDRLSKSGLSFLALGQAIAYGHHEKWNGKGYPVGLDGEHIPLSARIVALADAYDAMTTKRCYKEAFSHHKTREIICEESGSHFDPDIVEAFLAIENNFETIMSSMADPDKDNGEQAVNPTGSEDKAALISS
ncbi:HD domain-containing protein [bacterium]|nr:HD domain-containing protein [bacterium]